MRWIQLILLCCLVLSGSCRKMLEVGTPIDRQVSGGVYDSDVSAAAVLSGLYANMSQSGAFMGKEGLSYLCGLSADEYVLRQEDELSLSMYKNQMVSNNVPVWRLLYQYIYHVNVAIEGLSASSKLTPAIRLRLIGEAKFIRAFCYFYLVNLFGKVPLVTGTDYKVNAVMHRTPVVKVYEGITNDLQDAQQLLRNDYVQADIVSPTPERLRPNKWAATALLARVHLYQGNWQAAITAATALIENKEMYDTVSLNMVFLKDSKEAIWQLQPVSKTAMDDAVLFAQQRPVSISPDLLASFEENDMRKQYWSGGTTESYPYKYHATDGAKPITEYLVVLRLAEQYLIRAEARLRSGDLEGARADLNLVRTRAGLADAGGGNRDALLDAILQERRVELFSEWGHRWLDLKRTQKINAVMKAAHAYKGGHWQPWQQYYPIPQSEILLNGNLAQNEGYHD